MAEDGNRTQANLDFILDCLSKNEDALKINFHDAATKVGMTQSRNCQQKFKKLIESTKKYALVNGKVIDLEEDPDAAPATPAKRGRTKAATTPRSTPGTGRKRKAAATKETSDDNESEDEGTPAKKRATTKRGAAKKAAEKVKQEASDKEDGDDNVEADGSADKNEDDDDGDGDEGNGYRASALAEEAI